MRDVISDTHQLLLASWNGIKRDQWYFIGDKTNSQTVKNRKSYHHCLKQWNITVWNCEITTFDFTAKSIIHCLSIKEIEDIWFFRCKIDFYFTEWTPKAVFSRVAKPRVKIPLLVFMSEIKINLTPEKSNILFLLC